jgi:hypothetical protein
MLKAVVETPTPGSSEPDWLVAPGVSATRVVKFRPFSSSWVTWVAVTVLASSDDWVSTWLSVVPCTVTSVEAAPTFRTASTRARCPTLRTIPFAW